MKETQVNICISGETATEDAVNDALIELCKSKGWLMGGGVQEAVLENQLLPEETISGIVRMPDEYKVPTHYNDASLSIVGRISMVIDGHYVLPEPQYPTEQFACLQQHPELYTGSLCSRCGKSYTETMDECHGRPKLP